MAGGFVKVYGTILQSSIWLESPTTKVVWITMLALADPEGIVRSSVIGLAHAAHVRIPDCERALTVLASNDPESQTKTDDGKRIEAHDGGWLILNYRKYRELRTEDQIAAAVRQKRKRERDRDASRDGALHPTDKEGDKEERNYTADFELLWKAYPKRHKGSNKAGSYRLFLGHLKKGVSFDVMFEGVKRYALACIADGSVGTKFVKDCKTFLGPDKHFLDEHEVGPPAPPAGVLKLDRTQDLKRRGYDVA